MKATLIITVLNQYFNTSTQNLRFRNLLYLFFLVLSSASCQKTETGNIYRTRGTLNVKGRERTYLLNLPPNYYDTSGFSLVLALYGTGGNADQCERDYDITEKANQEKFIVVYPEGVASIGVLGIRTWNAGTCCGFAKDNNVDDVYFISELIDELISKYKIDPRKVYATGMSNGGMMVYWLASEIPGKIATIGVVSATMVTTQPCNPGRPVPVLHIHSAPDTKVPYGGGYGLDGYYFPPVDSTLKVWASIDACNSAPKILNDDSLYKLTEWTDCANQVIIKCYVTKMAVMRGRAVCKAGAGQICHQWL